MLNQMTLIVTQEYRSNGPDWQLLQLQRRVGEWWEWQFSRFNPDFPDLPEFSWLNWELLQRIGEVIFWLILILLLIGVGRALVLYTQGLNSFLPHSTTTTVKTKQPTANQWVERSQQYLKQNNYRDACLCLYQSMLELLDEQRLIPKLESRTDGEYWQLVEQFPHPQPYQALLLTHQCLYFGNVEASLKTWQNCEQAYQEITKYSQ